LEWEDVGFHFSSLFFGADFADFTDSWFFCCYTKIQAAESLVRINPSEG
jgi:hypothetical protein